ncbi:hypothetical protein SAY87_017140 [Trapa incisa]|uniref:Uncharacterized protein n=1 Tax=Trapa incisa TaxID=236973 RepID=A0AAN7LBC9_9MYRT|nr:hypothetical protein SAY87_017140 [Trapa incisa]
MRSRYPLPRPPPRPPSPRSTRCPYFCYSCKENAPKQEALNQVDGAPSCRHLDGVALRIIHGAAVAFFRSLERCSCIILQTNDDLDEPGHYLPLVWATRGEEDEDDDSSIEIEIQKADETSTLLVNK